MEFHAFLAKGVVIFFAILSGMFGGVSFPAPSVSPTATSTSTTTLSVLPNNGSEFFTPSFLGLIHSLPSGTSFPFSVPTPPANSTPVPNYTVVPPVVTPVTPPVVTTPTDTSGTDQTSTTNAGEKEVEAAIVNILCTAKKTGIRSISGSGFIVDARGIIFTAAHVGQYFLLEKASGGADMSCVIRMGDPAKTLYKATPIYVSQNWIADNSTAITEAMATGNGKNDYAILAITASATGGNLPSSFPHLTLGSVAPEKTDSIIIGTYGAEFLTSDQIRNALSPTIVSTKIKNTYSLGVTATDLISLGASAAAQSGSSGGVVVDGGRAIGVVTTSSLGADRSTRDLRAITIGHIRKSFEGETGGSLDLDLQASVASLIQRFAPIEQVLADTLYKVIGEQ